MSSGFENVKKSALKNGTEPELIIIGQLKNSLK
ncbi:Uncharacterised protein [Helicobacter pylori]|nr:Uncharacterised protein [Helicobacter pylori]